MLVCYSSRRACGEALTPRMGNWLHQYKRLQATLRAWMSLHCISSWLRLGSELVVWPSIHHTTHVLGSRCSFRERRLTLTPYGRTGCSRATHGLQITRPSEAVCAWLHTGRSHHRCVAGFVFLAPCQVAEHEQMQPPDVPFPPRSTASVYSLGPGPAGAIHKRPVCLGKQSRKLSTAA